MKNKNFISNLTNLTDAPSYKVIRENQASKAGKIVAGLKSKKEMVILHEILSPPKSSSG